MRLTDLLDLAEKYFILGIIAAGLMIGIFCIGYFAIYKKHLHGTAGIPLKKLAAAAVCFCYLVVVLGATMLDRSSTWSGTVLYPFMSYREAWNSFSIREWRNIILNICMFIPFGLLLPLSGRHWQKAIHTCLTGFALTLAIELAQLLLKRGIFELDDIFNNLLGTMTGYGLYRLVHYGYSLIQKKQPSLLSALLFQLPLVFTVMMFGTIFTAYQLQEFGNLKERYIRKVNMSAVDLKLNTKLSDHPLTVPVYQLTVADESETKELAREFFARLGTQLDESENDIYEETAVYWSTGRDYSLWIDYAGCPMHFTDFTAFPDENNEKAAGKSGCSRTEIQSALEQLGIRIPDDAVFSDTGSGGYLFEADTTESDVLIQGTLTCTYNTNDIIESFQNSIITYAKYDEREILSEQEAYERLKNGKFHTESGEALACILIDSVSLHYCTDSKGFYQPVYAFHAKVNGTEAVIEIPALK